MKKSATVFISSILLCLTLGLSACGVATVKPTVSPDVSPGGDVTSDDEQEALIARFSQAEMAYGWFTAHALVKTDTSDKLEIEGNSYFRVTDERFQTRSELLGYLRTLFDNATAEKLMTLTSGELQIFPEVDGKLYNLGGFIGQVSYDEGERKFTDVKIDGDSASFTLEISTEPVEGGDYGYLLLLDYTAKKVDGLWQFPNFTLPIIEYMNNAPSSHKTA